MGDQDRPEYALDCACGSGTLLSASYMAIKDRYILAGALPPQLAKLHRILLQHMLHGWDILDYAAHLTLTTLALHSTKTAITTSNVFVVPAGVATSGIIHLGSLDRLQPSRAFVGKGFTRHAQRKGLGDTCDEEIPEQQYDVVIMNPPFSRSAKPNIKFGYRDPKGRQKMNKALRRLALDIKQYGYDASAIGNAGLSAYFAFLAARLAKDNGRVAMVLPRSTLSGVAFTQVRQTYLRDFHIEYVVSNYDPGEPSMGIDAWPTQTS